MKPTYNSITLYDAKGRHIQATVIQEWVDAGSHDGPAQIPGLKSTRLSNGAPLNYVDENTFEHFSTGEKFTRTFGTK